MIRTTKAILGLGLWLALLAPHARADFMLTDLGTLGGVSSVGYGINRPSSR